MLGQLGQGTYYFDLIFSGGQLGGTSLITAPSLGPCITVVAMDSLTGLTANSTTIVTPTLYGMCGKRLQLEPQGCFTDSMSVVNFQERSFKRTFDVFKWFAEHCLIGILRYLIIII